MVRINTVERKLRNENKKQDDGEAAEAISPGMGVVVAGDGTVSLVSADAKHTQVALQHEYGSIGATAGNTDGPFDYEYEAGEHLEVTGFNRFDMAAVRVTGNVGQGDVDSGADVGWTDTGEMALVGGTEGVAEAVGYLKALHTDVSADFNLADVEFY